MILDVSTKGRVVGVEIINATRFLKEFDVEAKTLENLADAEFNAYIRPNSITLGIIFKAKNTRHEIPAKIVVPVEARF